MQKTVYQVPEIRDANDNVIQQGAFGKNTALSNATNDGWIDYVMNDLEALHDVVGETSPTLDANGHVVEPANLAIGDEDGNRIKNSYLKLTGGKVTGVASFRTDLRMLDNQDNRWGGLYVPGTTSTVQYLSLYGGTRATGDARLNLYSVGNGKFELTGYSTDGANAYTLTHDNNGNLKWRGTNIALANAYLPLTGGTMTGAIATSYSQFISRTVDTSYLQFNGGTSASNGAAVILMGKDSTSGYGKGSFVIYAKDDNAGNKNLIGKPDGTLTWNGKSIERISASGTGYIRYESGLQICYGAVGSMTSSGITVTFPQPFLATPVPAFSTSGATNFAYVSALTATDMTVKTSNNGGYVRYIAIGRWQ